MRFSTLFCPTLKESPNDADVISHQYMVRGGMIRRIGSGIYAYLPLGWRSIRKLEHIIREEMDKIDGQETLMPTIVPRELMDKTGRWDKYGHLLLKMQDRHEKDFFYGPTHEEAITDVAGAFLQSYKSLPLTLYQIQTKFRDEFRPRFGLMRGREFRMKDAYSFHDSSECLGKTYIDMKEAYERIFSRCGLQFKVVDADAGDIGGEGGSAEFMVTAQTGEDLIVECDSCAFASNVEAAAADPYKDVVPETTDEPMELVHTPGAARIKDVTAFFNMPDTKTLKTLIFEADGEPVAALIRGDYDLNEVKLKNVLQVSQLELIDDVRFKEITGTVPGYAGPVNMKQKIRMIADHSVRTIGVYICGANQVDYHYVNAVMGRDFDEPEYADLRNVSEGEVCQVCGKGHIRYIRGIEVGHIFKLGDMYAKAMGASYLNQDGKEKNPLMGCYGIGVGRTVAAAIEQNHDERGIKWPVAIAPYIADVIVINAKDEVLMEKGEAFYKALNESGIDAVFDDRKATAGVKFSDADLIGFPVQIILGKGFHNEGIVEIKWRMTGEVHKVSPDDVLSKVKELISTHGS